MTRERAAFISRVGRGGRSGGRQAGRAAAGSKGQEGGREGGRDDDRNKVAVVRRGRRPAPPTPPLLGPPVTMQRSSCTSASSSHAGPSRQLQHPQQHLPQLDDGARPCSAWDHPEYHDAITRLAASQDRVIALLEERTALEVKLEKSLLVPQVARKPQAART